MQSTKDFLMERGRHLYVPIALGDVVGGRYRVEAALGQGGMATVYRVRHTTTGRQCALKAVHAHLATHQRFVDLFIREAQIGARVGPNPHIVDVLDAGVDEMRNIPFLVMELLDGETLEQYVQARGPVPAPVLRGVLGQLANALCQAHAAGVVHRDLKPGNLFLTRRPEGTPHLKVLDFGIAKVLEVETQKTATQLGSPAYSAPEQMGPALRRIAARQHIKVATGVSPATDIWALGLVAYDLLTGLPAGQYWGVEAITELPTRIVLDEHEPASKRAAGHAQLLPDGFDTWFARCLKKDAQLRWPTANVAVDELLALLDSWSPLEASDSPSRHARQPLTLALAPTVSALPSHERLIEADDARQVDEKNNDIPSWSPNGSTPGIEVIHQDVASCECDILVMKYAQAFYGADQVVAHHLAKEPVRFNHTAVVLRPGEYTFIDPCGLLEAKTVLFLGVPPLRHFDQAKIRDFAGDALRIAASRAREPVTVAMTLHGVSYSPTEEQPMIAQLEGLILALGFPGVRKKVKRVIVVESLKERVNRFGAVLRRHRQ